MARHLTSPDTVPVMVPVIVAGIAPAHRAGPLTAPMTGA
jgi:hypothetical protein